VLEGQGGSHESGVWGLLAWSGGGMCGSGGMREGASGGYGLAVGESGRDGHSLAILSHDTRSVMAKLEMTRRLSRCGSRNRVNSQTSQSQW
jgi:hypothetical protein